MSGIEISDEVTQSQLEALAGGELLKAEVHCTHAHTHTRIYSVTFNGEERERERERECVCVCRI